MNIGKLYRSSFNFKHIVSIIAAVAFYAAAMFLFNSKVGALSKYYCFLSSRNYSHSVLVDRGLEQDSYAFYGKKIMFSTDEKMSVYINCETLMETGNKHTSSDFFYPIDVSCLGSRDIALSKNLMKQYDISIGNKVYSKHTYRNEIIEYTVKTELPEIYGIKEKDYNQNLGIALIGLDNEYFEHVFTDHIFFYNNDSSLINAEGANVSGGLVSARAAKEYIGFEKAKFLTITTSVVLVVSAASTIVLLFFNKDIYILKKRFGNSDSYEYFIKHAFGYQIVTILLSIAIYMIFSIWNPFVYSELLVFIFGSIAPSIIINSVFLLKMRRL